MMNTWVKGEQRPDRGLEMDPNDYSDLAYFFCFINKLSTLSNQ